MSSRQDPPRCGTGELSLSMGLVVPARCRSLPLTFSVSVPVSVSVSAFAVDPRAASSLICVSKARASERGGRRAAERNCV